MLMQKEFSNGYLSISSLPPLKLQEVLNEIKKTIYIINPDYDNVVKKALLNLCHEIGSIWYQ